MPPFSSPDSTHLGPLFERLLYGEETGGRCVIARAGRRFGVISEMAVKGNGKTEDYTDYFLPPGDGGVFFRKG